LHISQFGFPEYRDLPASKLTKMKYWRSAVKALNLVDIYLRAGNLKEINNIFQKQQIYA